MKMKKPKIRETTEQCLERTKKPARFQETIKLLGRTRVDQESREVLTYIDDTMKIYERIIKCYEELRPITKPENCGFELIDMIAFTKHEYPESYTERFDARYQKFFNPDEFSPRFPGVKKHLSELEAIAAGKTIPKTL